MVLPDADTRKRQQTPNLKKEIFGEKERELT